MTRDERKSFSTTLSVDMFVAYNGIQWKPDTMGPGRGTTIHVEVTSSVICYSTFFSPSLSPFLPFSLLPRALAPHHSIQIIVRSCICCSNVEGEYVGLVSWKSCHNLVAVRVVLSYEAGYNLQDSIMSFIEVAHAQGLGAMVLDVFISLHKVSKHWKSFSSSV